MAKSSKCATAHNEKEILTHFHSLAPKERDQAFNLLSQVLAKKTGRGIKTLFVITHNQKMRYSGNSIDIATTVYIQLLDHIIDSFHSDQKIAIEFYAIDENDNQTDLGGVQSCA